MYWCYNVLQPLLGEKYVAEKKRKKNNHKNSGHFVLLQCLRAADAIRWDHFCLLLTYNVLVLYDFDNFVMFLYKSLLAAESFFLSSILPELIFYE